jgi:hypothetical protein
MPHGSVFDPDRRSPPTMAFELARIWQRISSAYDVKRRVVMGTPESIDWDALNEPQEIAHDFEIDLHMLVTANHEFAIAAINRDEDEELAKINNEFHLESHEVIYSIQGQLQNTYDDFRRAARLLALVGLVTRLQHWISRFAIQRKLTSAKQSKPREPKLVTQLNALNKDLGDGPVSVEFFEKIVTLRDSVIHGDSQMEWGGRTVADEYRSVQGADLSEEQLQEAIQKAIAQVKHYDKKIQAQTSTKASALHT